MVGDRKIDIPSYTVTVAEEDSVHFTPESKIPEMLEKTIKCKEPKVEEPAEGEEAKSTEAKSTEAKSTEAKSTEAKSAEAKPAEAVKEDKPSTD